MNIQEMVAALRACADGRCEECPLENEDFTCSRNLWSETAGAVEAMAAELEKLRKPGPEWIPVKERLPENGTHALVMRFDYITNTPFYDLLWFDDGEWWNRHFPGEYSVTHWMPLTEPPEEG